MRCDGLSLDEMSGMLARLKKMEAFEESFHVQIAAHRELKEKIKNLDSNDTIVAVQQQITDLSVAQKLLRDEVKTLAAAKISPFEAEKFHPVVCESMVTEPPDITKPTETRSPKHNGPHRSRGRRKREGEGDKEGEIERELDETVWDAMFFINVKHIGGPNSALIAAALVAACCVQFIFILLVETDSFTGSSLPTLDDVKTWRYTIAHDHNNIDPLARTSLTSMLCSGSAYMIRSNAQAQLYGSVSQYLEPLPLIGDLLGQSGHVLCLMAVIVWSLIMSQELWSGVGQLMLAMIEIETAKMHTEISNCEDSPGMYKLHSVSVARKVFVFILLSFRLGM
jgi:hypothetical protein